MNIVPIRPIETWKKRLRKWRSWLPSRYKNSTSKIGTMVEIEICHLDEI